MVKIKFLFLVALVLAAGSICFAQSKTDAFRPQQITFQSIGFDQSLITNTLAPTATFESARIIHRVKYNNKWWMRIHIKFRIKGALSTPCKMMAYFYDDENEPLESGDDPKYRTTKGKVYAGQDFTPSLNDAVYNDFQLYVPYEALNLDTEPGSEYDLKYFLQIYDESTKTFFAKSGWYKFSLKY
jgi:hypothetical protein